MSRSDERGSILIMVLVGIVVLTVFSGWVIDQGTFWVSRSQTQNVADAGALSGAISRAFDEVGPTTPAVGGKTEQAILYATNQHRILGTANHTVTWSWPCPPGEIGQCVRVNVYRDGTGGSAKVPVYFLNMLGMTNQNMRATATAHTLDANGSNCLKPWLIPDKYTELTGNPNRFDLGDPVGTGDQYAAPGWTTMDIGTTLVLKPGSPSGAFGPGDFFEIEEAPSYEEAIYGCKITKGINDLVWSLPGSRVGPTGSGIDELFLRNGNKPVTVVIAMFSPLEFAQMDRDNGKFQVRISNMMGLRIDPAAQPKGGPQTIVGTIVAAPGQIIPGAATPGAGSAFLKVIELIR